MEQSQIRQEPRSGWDAENRHLVGMPSFIRDDPRAVDSGWLWPLCKRCANIPWGDLFTQKRITPPELRPTFEERVSELYKSRCRMCRLVSFIKTLGYTHFLGSEPAGHESAFRAKLRFYPGHGVNMPKAATPDLLAYAGIIDVSDGNIPFPRPAPAYADIALAQQWMGKCKVSHLDACTPDDGTRLHNLQVIDCDARVVKPAPAVCAYVALSYVWGPPSQEDIAYVFPSLPTQLPRTIEDAITVTKRLGIRYIWIDRYCINQNDPEDKMRQILQMGAIYSSAEVTIIAAAGSGPQHGLPGISKPRLTPMPYGEVVGSVALVVTSIRAVQEVLESTWASRSWTFQEGFLSQRRLFFTEYIMLYVCGQGLQGDVTSDYSIGDFQDRRILQQFVPLESPLLAVDDFVVQNKSMTLAGRQLKAFSRRQLTYDSDSLNAILGILDEMSKNKQAPCYHIWGVPFALYPRDYTDPSMPRRVSYEIALNWFHDDPCRKRAGFPSWSSIGWAGPIEYSYQDQPMVPDDVDIRVPMDQGLLTLEEYATTGLAQKLSGMAEAPSRLILVEARVLPIETANVDGYVRAVLKVSQGLDLYQWVSWDEPVPAGTQGLLGVIIYRDTQSRRLVMLVLARKEDVHERVGFILFDEDDVEWKKLAEGLVRVRGSSQVVTDLQHLRKALERPIRFSDEERRDIALE